jgi:RHS repeat-associated protein
MFPVTEPDIDEHIFLLYCVKNMTGCCCASSKERANFSQTRSEIERCCFTSKEYDEETGLYYMSARYMNPVASRWASSDPAGWELISPMDGDFSLRGGYSIVESMNPYSYCSNNPIMYNDPTGNIGWIAPVVMGIATLVALQSDQAPTREPVSPGKIMANLDNIHYKDPSQSSGNQRPTEGSITLDSNPIIAVGTGLPRGEPGPGDYDDGRSSTRGTIMGAIGLVGDTLSGMISDSGNFAGDVNFNYTKSYGEVSSWNLTLTGAGADGKTHDFIMPENDAKEYLNNNSELLQASGGWKNVSEAIGLE